MAIDNPGIQLVMPGLAPGIHVSFSNSKKGMDGRDKPGHDDHPYCFFPAAGSVPIILHNTISITSSAPPPIEVRRESR